MPDAHALTRILTSIDGRGYGSFKQLKGTYDLGGCRLVVDHVQVDPYAPPSLMRLLVDRATAGLPQDLLTDRPGYVATTDFLAREVADVAEESVSIGAPRHESHERTSTAATADADQARPTTHPPAAAPR